MAWQLGQEIGQSRAASEAAQERARVLPPSQPAPLLPPPPAFPDQRERLRPPVLTTLATPPDIDRGTPPFSNNRPLPPPPLTNPTVDDRVRDMVTNPLMARLTPLGFASPEQFADAVERFREASGIENATIGVRGSAATGLGYHGREFSAASDVDFFIVSDELFQRGVDAGAWVRDGALTVSSTRRLFTELHAVESALTQELGRRVTIRIFSEEGFNNAQTGDEVVGRQ